MLSPRWVLCGFASDVVTHIAADPIVRKKMLPNKANIPRKTRPWLGTNRLYVRCGDWDCVLGATRRKGENTQTLLNAKAKKTTTELGQRTVESNAHDREKTRPRFQIGRPGTAERTATKNQLSKEPQHMKCSHPKGHRGPTNARPKSESTGIIELPPDKMVLHIGSCWISHGDEFGCDSGRRPQMTQGAGRAMLLQVKTFASMPTGRLRSEAARRQRKTAAHSASPAPSRI